MRKLFINDKVPDQDRSFFLFCSQVETIGDAYMVVSGAPLPTPYHAVYICEMALDMVYAITTIADPSRPMDHLNIRVGTFIWLGARELINTENV